MASNRVSHEITPSNFLSRMELDHPYTMYALAAKFKVTTGVVKPLVLQLVEDGHIEAVADKRHVKYRRIADGEVIQKPVPVELSVAAPPLPPDMKGVLSGYESDFHRRAALAMLGRGTR